MPNLAEVLNLNKWYWEFANCCLKIILEDLKVKWKGLMRLYCDNKLIINIAHNLMQYDGKKHFEIDRHFVLVEAY